MSRRETPRDRYGPAWDRLSPRLRVFVRHFVTAWNASQAARAAGYRGANAAQIGYAMRHRQSVREALTFYTVRSGITPEAVTEEIAAMAWGPSVVDIEPWLVGGRTLQDLANEGVNVRAIQSAKVSADGTRELRLVDRLKALGMLATYLGMDQVTHHHDTEGMGPDLANASDEELARYAHATDADLEALLGGETPEASPEDAPGATISDAAGPEDAQI